MLVDGRNHRLCGNSLLAPLALACAMAVSGCEKDTDAGSSPSSETKDRDAGHDHADHEEKPSDAGSSDAGQKDAGDSDPEPSDAGRAVAETRDAGRADAEDKKKADEPEANSGTANSDKGYLVVVTERESPETSLQYLHVLESWPKDGKLNYDTAIELGEFVNVHALGNAVFVHQPEEGTVRKVVVKPNGKIDEDVKLSFAAQGAVGFAGDMIYVSPTRAYFLDEGSGQFVVWNPETMKVLGDVDLDKEVLTRENLPAQVSRGIALDDEGFVSMSWRDWDSLAYYDSAAIGVFDATSLEPKLRVLEDKECASNVTTPFDGGDGFVYLVSDAAQGFDALANPMRTKKSQCVLRLKPGATEFDKDFRVDLKKILGTPGFYATHPMKSGKLLVNLWAPDVEVESVANKDDPNWYWESPPYFEFAIVDLKAGTSIPVKDIKRAAVQWSATLRVDGDTYVQSYRDDKGSDLQRVDTDGTVTKVLANGASTDVQYIGRISH